MPLWLMHTYGGMKLGVPKLEKEYRDNFNLGNYSPDWNSLYPDCKLRRQTHFISDDYESREYDRLISDYYDKAESEAEKYFIKGYAYHIMLDYWWSKTLYRKHGFDTKNKDEYYNECFKWDKWITKQEGGMDCLNIMKNADTEFKDIKLHDESLLTNEALERVKKQAVIYGNAEHEDVPPAVFSEDEIEYVIKKAIETYETIFGKLK